MRDKTVGDCMTPVESVFMLDVDGVIDRTAMNEVHVLCLASSPPLASSLPCYYIRSVHQWLVLYGPLVPNTCRSCVWHVDSLCHIDSVKCIFTES